MISKKEIINDLPLFACLTDEERDLLAQKAELKKKPKYSFVFLSDEPSTSIYFLLKGTIKIGTHSVDGKEIIKSIIHPKALFGEMCILGEEKRLNFAKAMNENIEFLAINSSDVLAMMKTNHRLSNQFMAQVGTRLRTAETRLESLIFKDARSRIIDFLKDNVLRRGRKVGFEMMFKHSLTQQDIANLTGTSRQTVTSVLNELKKDNLIYFNRKSILIRDMAKL